MICLINTKLQTAILNLIWLNSKAKQYHTTYRAFMLFN